MCSKDNNRILKLRNETSTCLDAIVPMVRNGDLANKLREFSSEVMERTPGITLNLKQAEKLKTLTENAFKQYRRKAIRDADLRIFYENARVVFEGQNILDGGIIMGIRVSIRRMFRDKKTKKAEMLQDAKKRLDKKAKQIEEYNEIIQKCIENGNGKDLNSAEYKKNEREFNKTKKERDLCISIYNKLNKLILQAEDEDSLIDYGEQLEEIDKMERNLLNNPNELKGTIENVNDIGDKVELRMDNNAAQTTEFFEGMKSTATSSKRSSEYGAAVAEYDRLKDERAITSQTDKEQEDGEEEGMSEYSKEVKSYNDSHE